MRLFIFLLLLTINLISANSHEQQIKPVHQRIVYEAYKLLRLQLSKDNSGIAEIDNYLGPVSHHIPPLLYPWDAIYTLTGGAEDEDYQDIVYDTWWSRTHFWDIDNPTGYMHLHEFGYFPSAYIKSQDYIWDSYVKQIHVGNNETLYCYPDGVSYLHQWYWKESVWVTAKMKGIILKKTNYYDDLGNARCRAIFFNILGRLCHLLADMGVPEHAKRSIHPTSNEAPFEHWLRRENVYDDEFLWTAEKVYKERGGFVNPFCEMNNGDQNLYLFYTTAQLSDIFASYGRRIDHGNLNYNKNIGEVESIYKSYFPNELPKIHPQEPFNIYYYKNYMWLSNEINNSIGRAYRDALIPYTIRVVAGMLYKFIIESKMENRYGAPTEDAAGMIYDQQQELNLFNQDINGDYYTFRAEGTPGRITVCPDDTEGYFLIGPDTRNVTFRAANEIVFKPGFTATYGSQVHAYTCPDCDRDHQNGNCKQCLDEDFNPQYDR